MTPEAGGPPEAKFQPCTDTDTRGLQRGFWRVLPAVGDEVTVITLLIFLALGTKALPPNRGLPGSGCLAPCSPAPHSGRSHSWESLTPSPGSCRCKRPAGPGTAAWGSAQTPSDYHPAVLAARSQARRWSRSALSPWRSARPCPALPLPAKAFFQPSLNPHRRGRPSASPVTREKLIPSGLQEPVSPGAPSAGQTQP